MTYYGEEEMARLAEQVADDKITLDTERAGQVDLPPAAETEAMVACSLRLPVGVYQRIKALASNKGMKPTALMRDWVQEGLASTEEDRLVSVADLLRAVARLPEPPPGMAA